MSGKRVQQFISAHLLMPSYVIFVGSMIVRGLAGVISTMTVPYGEWNFLLRLVIEMLAVIGILICTEIINSASAASWAARRNDLAFIESSPDYVPNPRLKGQRLAEQAALLARRKDAAVARCKRDMNLQLGFSIFCGTVSVLYGVIFAVNSATHTSFTVIATEVILVVTAPPVVFYMSAIFSEEHDPMAKGQEIALGGLEKRLELAKERVSGDTHTNDDVDAIAAALPDNPQLKKIVGLLRRADPDKVFKARDLYRLFGIKDASSQSQLRRNVRQAGEAGKWGVVPEAGTGEWLIPASAIVHLVGNVVAKPNTYRTVDKGALAVLRDIEVARANTARTTSEHTDALAPVGAQ